MTDTDEQPTCPLCEAGNVATPTVTGRVANTHPDVQYVRLKNRGGNPDYIFRMTITDDTGTPVHEAELTDVVLPSVDGVAMDLASGPDRHVMAEVDYSGLERRIVMLYGAGASTVNALAQLRHMYAEHAHLERIDGILDQELTIIDSLPHRLSEPMYERMLARAVVEEQPRGKKPFPDQKHRPADMYGKRGHHQRNAKGKRK